MGTVYLALSHGPGGFSKLKVVKRLRPDLAADPAFLQMFLDEARIAARLNHPNVVQTFEVGFDGVNYFFEMEYLEGVSLDALLRRATRDGGLPLELALWVLHQALEGLHYAHELRDTSGEPLRVVHRDVSPHNVFVTYEGAVKILDFGIAKAADSSAETRTGVIKGKTTYMAPEQAERKPVDRRADVFAIGVIMWEALTGTRLWADLGDTEILERLRRGEIPPLRSVKPGVPQRLERACTRALAHRPEERFATAEELQEAIEEHLESSTSRVGNRQLGKYVAQLFADRRAAVQEEIDEQLRDASPGASRAIDVPVLGDEPAARPTSSGEVSTGVTKPNGSGRLDPPTGAREGPRPRRAPLAAGAAAFAAVALASVLAIRARGSSGGGDAGGARTDPASCARDEECGAGVCAAGACVARASVECTSNRQCVEKARAAAICRKDTKRCVALASEDCVVLAEPGDAENDETIWYGAMFPTTGPLAKAAGIPARNAVDLARRDFAKVARGTIRIDRDYAPPLGVVACNDAVESRRAAEHLAEVGAPSVIGFRSSKSVLELAPALFIPREMLVLSALNSSPLLTSIPQRRDLPRLVYRTTISTDRYADSMAALVADVLEPAARQREPRPGFELRVATVRSSSTTAHGFADSLMRVLHFNGRSAVENRGSYRELTYGDAAPEGLRTVFASFLPELLAFKPHVVIFPPDAECLDALITPLDEALGRAGHKPWFLTTDLYQEAKYLPFFTADPTRGARFLSVNVAASTLANVSLTLRYNEEFEPKVTATEAPATAYDSFYVLGFATTAALRRSGSISGPTLASALESLTRSGPEVLVGPTALLRGLGKVAHGESIRLRGACTDLDIAPDGEPHATMVVYCTKADAARGTVVAEESNLVYDRARSAFGAVALRCP